MFTGIIESLGKVISIEKDKSNLIFEIQCQFIAEVKIDQSIAHNGVCLTVEKISKGNYFVSAIDETLKKTNLNSLKIGEEVNLERCMQLGGRLDGHIVQGHVDCAAKCIAKKEIDGSWEFTFEYHSTDHITVEKGSITINGVSLTVVNSHAKTFSVAIIPYTFEHTNFRSIELGDSVNLEFDIIGKYVQRMLAAQLK